jgi:hypothetical protein
MMIIIFITSSQATLTASVQTSVSPDRNLFALQFQQWSVIESGTCIKPVHGMA